MDKDKLRKSLREWSEPGMACESLSDEDMLDMVLDAAQAYLAILDGDKVVVPREPTEGMVTAGYNAEGCSRVSAKQCFSLMLAAAEKGE